MPEGSPAVLAVLPAHSAGASQTHSPNYSTHFQDITLEAHVSRNVEESPPGKHQTLWWQLQLEFFEFSGMS